MKKRATGLFFALAALTTTSHLQSQPPKGLDVQIVKYDGLKDLILKNRGKVVLVDVWFTL